MPDSPEDGVQNQDNVIEIFCISIVYLISEQRFGSFHLEEAPIVAEVPVGGVQGANHRQCEIAHLIGECVRVLRRIGTKDHHQHREEIFESIVRVRPNEQIREYEPLYSSWIRVLTLLRRHYFIGRGGAGRGGGGSRGLHRLAVGDASAGRRQHSSSTSSSSTSSSGGVS